MDQCDLLSWVLAQWSPKSFAQWFVHQAHHFCSSCGLWFRGLSVLGIVAVRRDMLLSYGSCPQNQPAFLLKNVHLTWAAVYLASFSMCYLPVIKKPSATGNVCPMGEQPTNVMPLLLPLGIFTYPKCYYMHFIVSAEHFRASVTPTVSRSRSTEGQICPTSTIRQSNNGRAVSQSSLAR